MVSETLGGWGLVFVALVVLSLSGQLEWLAVLVPLSILAGFGITLSRPNRTKLTPAVRKR
jgi:hypothetical protein